LTKKQRGKLASRIYASYRMQLLVHLHIGHKDAVVGRAPSLADQPPKVRQLFARAANTCNEAAADPDAYVTAQFEKFVEYSRFARKNRLPQPHHLHGLGALARYVEYAHTLDDRKSRAATEDSRQVKEFWREERKLKGLTRVTRMLPSDVLTERPEEFTPAFLEHKGVWDLVEDIYDERTC